MKTQLRRSTPALLLFLVLNASASVFCVDVNSTNATPPYTDWVIAATNIQDAVDLAQTGDTVLVTNGVYATGGRSWYGSGTNRVTLTNAVTLQSVNGPAVTLIVGNRVPGSGLALTNAVRCVAIGSSAVLSGFTLTNGEAGTGNYPNGGGVMLASGVSPAGTVTDCVLVGNLATNSVGGGAYRVRLINCQITGNSADSGGGACSCTLVNCTVVSNTATSGGGVFGGSVYGPCVLTNCMLTGNSATGSGGGAYGGVLANCVVVSNKASTFGGGAYGGVLNNCIVTENSTGSRGGGAYAAALSNCTVVANSSSLQGGGVDEGQTLLNCIIYYNSASFGPNINGGGAFTNCCTTPLPVYGANNLTNAPLFLNQNGDFHLQSNSPCINAGNNVYVSISTDLDGNPRIQGGTVDIGAYEFQNPSSVISYAWLQQYGLPTDGTADSIDTDHDGINNWQEWIAGTDPTNASSVLKMLTPSNSVSGIRVNWQSVSGKTYFLQRSTNLFLQPVFSSIQSNILGKAGTTSFTDTNAAGTGPYFYRVGMQQ